MMLNSRSIAEFLAFPFGTLDAAVRKKYPRWTRASTRTTTLRRRHNLCQRNSTKCIYLPNSFATAPFTPLPLAAAPRSSILRLEEPFAEVAAADLTDVVPPSNPPIKPDLGLARPDAGQAHRDTFQRGSRLAREPRTARPNGKRCTSANPSAMRGMR